MICLRKGLCLLLCLSMLLGSGVAASAEEESAGNATGILDAQELTARVESIISELGLDAERLAVGFYYAGTGDTYFYHGDRWMYSASLFKVPLYMALDDEIADGKIRESGSDFTISTVDTYRDRVLINSVTGPAKWLMGYFGSYQECREEYRRYSELPDDYFPDTFAMNSYFSARFMVDVMAWLLEHADRYPKTLDSLYRSPVRQDLTTVGEHYKVAQKYGDFADEYVNVHHMAAIIDTPTPIVVVVMTSGSRKHRLFMNEVSAMLADYSLELDRQTAADKSTTE